MSYLIDTNVLSELRRKSADPGVVGWFSRRAPSTLHLSVLTLGAIHKGIEGVDDEVRRQSLIDWLETDLPTFFTGRILSVDGAVADRWGRMIAAAGRPPRWNITWCWSPATSRISPACPFGFSTPGRTEYWRETDFPIHLSGEVENAVGGSACGPIPQLAAPLAPQANAPTTRTTACFRMHATSAWHDPDVAEIHATRERLVTRHHNDLKT